MNFTHILEIIVKSNAFNFIVLAGILLFVLRKINLPEILSKLQKNIENKVNDSTLAKTESEVTLKSAEEKMENVEKDIEKLVKDTKKTAKIISENIMSEAKEKIEIIENNAKRVVENDTNKTYTVLSNLTAKTSITLLRENLKANLKNDENLHNIFIDEAIDELEGIKI